MIGRVLCVAALSAGLAGCAVGVTQINGPDGRAALVMKCSGYGVTRQDCLVEAGKRCPGGWTIIDSSSRLAGFVMAGNVAIPASEDYLTVSCK